MFYCFRLGLRSSKRIRYFRETDTWHVYNEIDESGDIDLSEEEMLEKTNIGEALNKGALYKYVY